MEAYHTLKLSGWMGAGWETTLHVVAAILLMTRDSRLLHVCSSVMISEYPYKQG